MDYSWQYIEAMGALHNTLRTAWSNLPFTRWRVPSRCAICRHWPDEPVCELCIARFAQPRLRCISCALPVAPGTERCGICLHTPPPLDLCLCAVDYVWPWRGLISRFKYHDQPGWAQSLAWLMRSAAWAEDTLQDADALLPIPLSAERLAERGYNQSWLLARHLAPQKTQADWLLRIQHTPAQRSLPRTGRMHNVRNAFALDPLHAAQVRGQKLVLIDDVMTSGATLHAAAHVLRQAGAQQVSAMVLARTGLGEVDHEGEIAAPSLNNTPP